MEIRDPKSQLEMLRTLKEWFGVQELKGELTSKRSKQRRELKKSHMQTVEHAMGEAKDKNYGLRSNAVGLRNAPSTFQRTMTKALGSLINHGELVYNDDIIIYSRGFEKHIELLDQVLQ